MSAGGSFVSSLAGGIEAGQRIVDRYDEERDEDRQEQMLLADRERTLRQSAEDRTMMLADRERKIKLSTEDRAMRLADRERQIDRQATQDKIAAEKMASDEAYRERQLKLQELSAEQQRRVADARMNNNLTQQQVAELEIRSIEQNEKAVQAQQLSNQASQLFKQGDYEQGLKIYSELNELGLGTRDVIEGKYSAQEAEDVISGLMSGEIDLDSKESQALASKLLMPSFLASGRDPGKYEPAGIRESRPGAYAIEIRNKETGEIVPATHFQTDHNDDPITEISEESLMQGAVEWLKKAREAEGAMKAMDAQKQIAAVQARYLSDRTSKKKVAAGNQESGLPENQQAFIDLQATEGEQNLARMLIAEDGYDEMLPKKIQRIRDIAAGDNTKDKAISLSDALLQYRRESEIDLLQSKRVQQLTAAGVDEDKAIKFWEKVKTRGMGADEIRAGVAKLMKELETASSEPARNPPKTESGALPWAAQ